MRAIKRGEGDVVRLVVALVASASLGCATVNNTVDKSRTVSTTQSGSAAVTGIAVPAVPENAAAEGLARDLGLALPSTLRSAFPDAKIVDAAAFGARLQKRKGYLAHFARWRSTYEQSGVMEPTPLVHYASAAGGVSHLLLVRSTHLDREKVSVGDALAVAPCRRLVCTSLDANNVWETRLKVLAELIDVGSGVLVWRGVGEAVRVQQGSPRLDFGLFIVEPRKGAGVESLARQMVSIAAEGMVKQIQAGRNLTNVR